MDYASMDDIIYNVVVHQARYSESPSHGLIGLLD
jgi:hypothetical protein